MIYSIYQHDRWGQRSLSNHTYILLCMNRAFQQKKPAVLTNALVSECESCKQHRWYIVTCCIHIGQYSIYRLAASDIWLLVNRYGSRFTC